MKKFSKTLLESLKEIEGFRDKPYKDQKGVLTIGYGHTAKAGYPDPRNVENLTKEEAEQILIKDLTNVARQVDRLVTVDLPENKMECLYSFAFNIGISAFAESTLLKDVNEERFDEIEQQLRRWCYVDKKINKGLQNRREKEISLWNKVQKIPITKKHIAVCTALLTTLGAKITEILENNHIAQIVFIIGIFATILTVIFVIVYELILKDRK